MSFIEELLKRRAVKVRAKNEGYKVGSLSFLNIELLDLWLRIDFSFFLDSRKVFDDKFGYSPMVIDF